MIERNWIKLIQIITVLYFKKLNKLHSQNDNRSNDHIENTHLYGFYNTAQTLMSTFQSLTYIELKNSPALSFG